MSYLLEILGRGLLAELSCAFREVLHDDGHYSLEELQDAAAGQVDTPEPAVRLATRCLSSRDYPGARRAFEAALAVDPEHLAALVGLACVCDEVGRVDEGLAHLRKAQQAGNDDPTVWFALGYCHEKKGEIAPAVNAYEQCLAAAPNLRNAHERLAAIHLKHGHLEGAIDHYEQICWHEPGEVVPVLTLANLYLQAGRLEDAVRRFQFALTIEPDNWQARDDLAAAYEQAGLYREAIDQLDEMVRTQPAFADNHLRLGDLHTKLGDHPQALTEYQTAAELNPDYLEAVIKVGTTHLRRGDYAKAADWFGRAVELNDRILAAYVGLGVAQQELGQMEEALASFEMAGSVEPNSTLLFSETARLQLKMAVNQQAERYLSPAQVAGATADPPAPPVNDLIDRQIERHRASLHQRPNYADLHYRLGLLLKHRGELDEALECFQTATQINPQYAKAMIQLGLSLQEAGRQEEAIAALTSAVDCDSESVAIHYQLGLMFADRNEFALALEKFEHVLEQEPDHIDFHANLALALQNMGLLDRAEAAWQILWEVAQNEQTTTGQADRSVSPRTRRD